ncbi:MAG: hypothetical protein H0W88_01605 [Parachlamydiaceae bacterium]|nr:hypothetical protein [Parachlamydiaceae bacterium]
MKIKIWTSFFLALVTMSKLCNALDTFEMGSRYCPYRPQYAVINISECSKENIEDFFQGKIPNIAIECNKGQKIPLKIKSSGDFLAIGSNINTPLYLNFVNTCYIQCTGEKILFSKDLHTWKNLEEFFTSSFGFGIDEQQSINFNLELIEKK